MKNSYEKINCILDAKSVTNFYREQTYQSLLQFKLEINFRILLNRRMTFLTVLLNKLKEEIKDYGYIVNLNNNQLEYLIKLDPLNVDQNIYLFYKIKEVFDFSESQLQIMNIKLCFQKVKGMNYDKIHYNLITYILNQKECFSKAINLICSYREYLENQINFHKDNNTINYLKRNEIEIQNIIPEINILELKNIIKGLLCEIYEESFSWIEKRKIRSKRVNNKKLEYLVKELNQTSLNKEKTNFTKKDKVLVYALDRRTPVLLPLSRKLQDELTKEMSKIAV